VEQLEITEVRIRKIDGDGNLRAFASITFDSSFVVHDLKVIKGKKGYFIAMPSKRMNNGDFKDMAHPIVSETRMAIQETVLAEYRKVADEDEVVENSLLITDNDEDSESQSMSAS